MTFFKKMLTLVASIVKNDHGWILICIILKHSRQIMDIIGPVVYILPRPDPTVPNCAKFFGKILHLTMFYYNVNEIIQ